MAMNKAEREELERLKQEVALAKALRFSALPAPVLIPPPDSGTTTGWIMNSYYFGSVEQAWSESDAHGFGLKSGVQTGSRDGISLYRSKLDAYVGLRLAKEMEFAKHLADIDAIIETVRAASSEEIAARYSMGRP